MRVSVVQCVLLHLLHLFSLGHIGPNEIRDSAGVATAKHWSKAYDTHSHSNSVVRQALIAGYGEEEVGTGNRFQLRSPSH